MEIYDIDKDLNKLLNEPGMNDALKEYGNKFFWSRLLGYIPIAMLVMGACCSLPFSDKVINLVPIISNIIIFFFLSYVITTSIHEIYIQDLAKISNDVYEIMKSNKYKWKYLVYVLDERIEQSKHKNDVYEKAIKIVFSLLGLNLIYYVSVNIKTIYKSISLEPVGVIKAGAWFVLLVSIVYILVDSYTALINSFVRRKKWEMLLNHATKLKFKLKKI